MTTVQPPINLKNWIEDNADKFKPPVSNRYLYDGRDFFVMVIKGPNARNDFHLVDSEEYGLVVERRRPPGENEHVIFYCENCGALVEDIHFDCKDIVDHFSQAMLEFWADDARRTCKKCGKKVEKAQPVKAL